jgi:hypothetical protein
MMPDWKLSVLTKAIEEPEFFEELMESTGQPGPVAQSRGISLTPDEESELRELLSRDELRLEWSWNNVRKIARELEQRGGIRGWSQVVQWK